MALRIKNKAKAAFICGVASCACAVASPVLWSWPWPHRLVASPAWDIISVLSQCVVVLGIVSAIAGLVFCRGAVKESTANRSRFFSAGLILSVLGFVLICLFLRRLYRFLLICS